MSQVKAVVALIVVALLMGVVVIGAGSVFENLSAHEVMIIQSPVRGKLRVCTEQGPYWQGFGHVVKYPRRAQFWFSSRVDEGSAENQSIKVRFNDNAHADMSGSLTYELPTDESSLIELYRRYPSLSVLERDMIQQQVFNSVYMTGSLMSSRESAAEKRPDLLYYLQDQIQSGVYRTVNQTVTEIDALTSITKTRVIAQVVKKPDGTPDRVENSLLAKFKVHASNVTINNIKYDDVVEKQLQAQQQAIMDIQTAMAEGKKAEQRKLTAELEGQAQAAKEKWEQEAIKAREVTKADQEKAVAVTAAEKDKQVAELGAQKALEVAKLDKQTADQFKQAETLRGEGEAARRRAVLEADNALEAKLKAMTAINEIWANAFKDYKGQMVPSIVMGGGGTSNGTSTVQDMMNLLTVQTARTLAIDMGVTGTLTHRRAP